MSDRLRGACGIAAIAVVVVGASARSHLSMSINHGSTKSAASGIAGAVLLAAGLVVAIVLGVTAAFERRSGKRRAGEATRRRPWLQALVMFVIVFGTVLMRRAVSSRYAVEDNATSPTPTPQTPLPTPASHGAAGGASVIALLVAIAILVVCAAAVWGRRRQHRRQFAASDAGNNSDLLQQALRDGTAAMHDVADARQAIIACYVAMRATLQAAGIAVRVSDTATQMLARASGASFNLPAAQRLTELFLEARFSTHQVSDDARAAALDALNELRYRQPATVGGPLR
jgi:hypothetical protein